MDLLTPSITFGPSEPSELALLILLWVKQNLKEIR